MKAPFLLVLIVFVIPVFAQTSTPIHDGTSQGPPPLQVSVVESHELTTPGIEADVTNVSDKCIRGYVIDLTFLRDDGTVWETIPKMSLFRDSSGCMSPHVSIHGHERSVREANGDYITHGTATVELVVFGDGTEWGVGNSETAGELRGFFRGVDYATHPHRN